jgi:hypothetical protein
MPHAAYTPSTSEESVDMEPHPVKLVVAVPKTVNIYPDFCRIQVSFSIFPNTKLAIENKAQLDGVDCPENTDQVNGIGTCTFEGQACLDLFDFPAALGAPTISNKHMRVAETSDGTATVSADMQFWLYPQPLETTSVESSTFVRANVPRSPRKYGDPFVMHTVANTGDKKLGTWAVDIIYDSDSIEFISVSTHPVYDILSTMVVIPSAEAVHGDTAQKIAFTGSKKAGALDENQFSGPDVHLMNLNFNIKAQATSGVFIYSAITRFLTSTALEAFVVRQNITVDDANSITSPLGTAYIHIENTPQVVQLLATSNPKYTVLLPDGTVHTSSITAWLVYGSFQTPNEIVETNALTCVDASTTTSGGLSIGGCASISPTSASPATYHDAAYGAVQVTHDDTSFYTMIPVATYVTKSVDIIADQSTLSFGCVSMFSERTRLRKMVVFDQGYTRISQAVDVSYTDYDFEIQVQPNADNLQIADSFFVKATQAGTATIAPILQNPSMGISYTHASITANSVGSGTATGMTPQP